MDCARQSIKAEGYRVFARGLSSTMIRAFPTNAATFYVYTYARRWLGQFEDDMENIENLAVMNEIVSAARNIVSEVESAKVNHQSHVFSHQKILECNKGKFLPEVLHFSRELWHGFVEDYYLEHHAGETPEKDLYKAIVNMVRATKHIIRQNSNAACEKIIGKASNEKYHVFTNAL